MSNCEKLKMLKNLPKGRYALSIGNFDGVHKGHQQLLNNFVGVCKKRNLKPLIITFRPHPAIFLDKGISQFLLTNYEDKLSLIHSHGIDHVCELSFDEKLQMMEPKEFIELFFLEIDNLDLIYLGHDFKLGKGKVDSYEVLSQIAKENKIEILREDALKLSGNVVSSTRIRKMLNDNIGGANELIGRNYSISGTVVKGKGIGKRELFNTANLKPDEYIKIPSSGVYITEVLCRGKEYKGVTNIGINPTIGNGNCATVETHILNFSQLIYDESIKLKFIKKIRNEKKFDSLLKLKEQITKDVEEARTYFRNKSKIKLALIGKNISHSKSHEIYEKLLGTPINYTLLDFNDSSEICSLENLQAQFMGVSITSPYKKHFISKVELANSKLNAINCLSFNMNKSTKVIGYNTDYLAVQDILQDYIAKGINEFIVLGDGVMGKLTCMILDKLNKDFEVLSRKNGSLKEANTILSRKSKNCLVVNTCSREYLFKPEVSDQYNFWDMNYNLDYHTQVFENSSVSYDDGIFLLELQAKYALSFWNLETI